MALMHRVRDAYTEALSAMDINGLAISQQLPVEARMENVPICFFNFFPLDWVDRSQQSHLGRGPGARHGRPELIDSMLFPDNGYIDPACGDALTIHVFDRADSVRWSIRHDPTLFEDDTIEFASQCLANIIQQASDNSELYISNFASVQQIRQRFGEPR